MAPTPFRIAQTSSEAKRQHKQHGAHIPARQQKQLERLIELDSRAARIRDSDERRRAAKKKREEQARKDKRAREQLGVGLATQLIGYSHTQAQLKSGMEAFLGLKKASDRAKQRKEAELAKTLEAIADSVDKDPCDDNNGDNDDNDDGDDDSSNDNNNNDTVAPHAEQWADDDLDDDTLLQAHDLLIPDPINAPPDKPHQLPPPLPPAKPSPCAKEDAELVRLHGPINKAIEAMLDKLPSSLVELLSLDCSMKLPDWNPAPALLHKLNPLGLPPHRLRIKSGCVVSLLRDLNTSSQLSKSQHLRILRIESERLECLVLDGQLQGTKTFLTRIAFLARYRNDDKFLFQRIQYPIRVANDYKPCDAPQITFRSNFKLPSIHGWRRPPSANERPNPPISIPKPHANPNPSFKRPGLPASKSATLESNRPAAIPKPVELAPHVIDDWDEFLESGTQIARELSADAEPTPVIPIAASPPLADCLPPLSTQDFDFSLDDLDDEPRRSPVPHPTRPRARDISVMPSTKPVTAPQQTARIIPTVKQTMLPPSNPAPTVLKRKPPQLSTRSSLPPPKRSCITPSFPRNSCVSLSDFGLSTQDVVSLFDDDEVWG